MGETEADIWMYIVRMDTSRVDTESVQLLRPHGAWRETLERVVGIVILLPEEVAEWEQQRWVEEGGGRKKRGVLRLRSKCLDLISVDINVEIACHRRWKGSRGQRPIFSCWQRSG